MQAAVEGPEMQRWGKLPEGVFKALAAKNGALLTIARGDAQAAGAAAQKLVAAGSGGYAGQEVSGPDVTKGYDVQEYGKIWQALSEEKEWPKVQRFSVIGPAGEEFLSSVKSLVLDTMGQPPEKIEVIPKTRFQSVRLDVRCASPDDFCLLHSRLKTIPNAKFLL
mmetsp:Transcript_6371/g.11637  ORF Transcript_6371/g.11637 Transcript_6371/m.11637 type:complete len:165 (-) Transcript_6371:315-809(-)